MPIFILEFFIEFFDYCRTFVTLFKISSNFLKKNLKFEMFVVVKFIKRECGWGYV